MRKNEKKEVRAVLSQDEIDYICSEPLTLVVDNDGNEYLIKQGDDYEKK
jgi:hypothetical protein